MDSKLELLLNKINLDNVLEFKKNKKSYIFIESINIVKQYENEKTIELIDKKLKSFLKMKHNRKIYVHGILGNALTDFEKKTYEKMGLSQLTESDNKVLYELDLENA